MQMNPNNKTKGLLFGTYQGLIGLILKPVAGILDFTSNTTRGIKEFVQNKTGDYYNKRHRHPRMFYGE